MTNQKTIICAFCRGTGKNPHFTGTCPVCKGKGKNTVVGPYMPCKDCRGTGQKRGTTLTCYTCGGLGVVPDMREIFQKAKKEIKKARKEMAEEREEFREKSSTIDPEAKQVRSQGHSTRFCQCCGKKVEKSFTVKVCLDCVQKIKEAGEI